MLLWIYLLLNALDTSKLCICMVSLENCWKKTDSTTAQSTCSFLTPYLLYCRCEACRETKWLKILLLTTRLSGICHLAEIIHHQSLLISQCKLQHKTYFSPLATSRRGHRDSEGCQLWVLWSQNLGDITLVLPSSSSIHSSSSSFPFSLMVWVNILYIDGWVKAEARGLWRDWNHTFSI